MIEPIPSAEGKDHTGKVPGTFLAFVVGALCALGGAAAEDDLSIGFDPITDAIELLAPEDRDAYFILEGSADLDLFSPAAIDFGSPAPLWEVHGWRERANGFFRLVRHDLSYPVDTDGDGIDDVYELSRSETLNPLDPTDAEQDPDGDGFSQLHDYRLARLRGRVPRGGGSPQEVYSREVSVFNFGAPTSAIEAISAEVSVYNGETPPTSFVREAYSREVSVFNYGAPTAFIEAISPEVSVFNFGAPPARVEAISREISLYNGESPPASFVGEAYSRELSIFNFGEPSSPQEAISREVSVFNFAEDNP